MVANFLPLSLFIPPDLSSVQPQQTLHTKSCEVSGQCSTCFDFFSVTVRSVRGRPVLQETARLMWVSKEEGTRLVHRPGLCNGTVKLYGSLETLSLPTPTSTVVL